MMNVADFPKQNARSEAPTVNAKTLDAWNSEQEEEAIKQTGAGAAAKSREKIAGAWVAEQALDQKGA